MEKIAVKKPRKEEIKVVMPEEQPVKIPDFKPASEKDVKGSWYPVKQYYCAYGYVKVCGCITGCGLAQMYGVSHLNSKRPEDVKVIQQIKKDYIDGWGAGGILATLGHTYKHLEHNLLALGFEKIAEYPNWHHMKMGGGTEIQTLYILKK